MTTPIERLGLEIVDAGITWTDGMRAAWERADAAEKECRRLLHRAANELAFSLNKTAHVLYHEIDDRLMDIFYEDGEEPGFGGDATETHNVEVTGAARLYRAASVWTAGLGIFAVSPAPTFKKRLPTSF